MDFSNILTHPDKEEILSKLLNGTDPKDINQFLKLKYPNKDQKHLLISIKCLQDFSKTQYTKFYNQYSEEITANIQHGGTLDKRVATSLLNNKTFQERLGEHGLKEINVRERFLSIDLLIRDRIEQVFDKIQEDPGGWRGDYILMKWIEQYLSMVEKYDKSQNNRPDQIIQHNYTLQYIDQQTAAMQEAFKRVLSRVDPELAFQNIDERISEVTALENTILNAKDKV
jgi:hypothetical protein